MGKLQDIFLNLHVECEDEVGVIKIAGHIQPEKAQHDVVEPSLIRALELHFDSSIKIVSCKVYLDIAPIIGEAYVKIETLGEDIYRHVKMKQTYLID